MRVLELLDPSKKKGEKEKKNLKLKKIIIEILLEIKEMMYARVKKATPDAQKTTFCRCFLDFHGIRFV